jgi:hypothetical protein
MPTSIKNYISNTIPPVIGKQTIWIPGYGINPAVANGAIAGTAETTTNAVNIRTLNFDATVQEFGQFAILMPKSWNEGTLQAQFVWSHDTTTTNFGVVWGIQATAFANGDALDASWGAQVTVPDTGGTANTIYISDNSPAFTVAGTPGPEEFVMFRVARNPGDAADTLAVDARLQGIKLYYTVDAARDD